MGDGQFKKGYDPRRNAKGRPRRKTIGTLLADLPEELREYTDERTGHKLSPEQLAVVQLLRCVAEGKPWAIKEFLLHICGRPMQAVEIEADLRRDDLDQLTDEEIQARIEELKERISGQLRENPWEQLSVEELREFIKSHSTE